MLNERSDAADRRKHPRTQLKMTVRGIRLDPEGGDVVDTLHMVDISRGGMGAISDRPYYPGQRMVLCLPMSSTSGGRNIYATIVRCRQTADGYQIGLAFDNYSLGAWNDSVNTMAAAA